MPSLTRPVCVSAIFFCLACGPDLSRRDGRLTVEVSDVPTDATTVTLFVRQGDSRFEQSQSGGEANISFDVGSVPVGEVRVDVVATGSADGNRDAGRSLRIAEADNLLRLSLARSERTTVRGSMSAVLEVATSSDEVLIASGPMTGWASFVEDARSGLGGDPGELLVESISATLRPNLDVESFDDLWGDTVLLSLDVGGTNVPLGTGTTDSEGSLLMLTPVARALQEEQAALLEGAAVTASLSGDRDGGLEGVVRIDLLLTVLAVP